MKSRTNHFFGATLIIAGVNIGVGMLALPVVTAAAGFFPSIVLYCIACLFMISLARLILEACTRVPLGSNLITITKRFLGTPGAIACFVIYLFLFYCLLIAHIAAGGNAVFAFAEHLLPHWFSTLVYLIVFVPFIYLGTYAVDRLNRYLMIGVVLTFVYFIGTSSSHVQWTYLVDQDWIKVIPALPIVLSAFGFQNLVPTLYSYMKGDHVTLRKAIWVGTLFPLLFYITWELFTVGIVSKDILIHAKAEGLSVVEPLQQALHNNTIAIGAAIFATLAMTTSFLGMSIAFMDFWADALKWEKRGLKHVLLTLLVFVLPTLAVLIDPSVFILALNLAGGVGEVLLYGVLPVLYVWAFRYRVKRIQAMPLFVPGGKGMLACLLFFSLLTLLSFFVL
jgi:tyrosine-specific transport protein